jgi:hypothetical protein
MTGILRRVKFAYRGAIRDASEVSDGVTGSTAIIVYGGGIELLSRPKPLWLEWRDATAARALSAVPVEGEAIYVWLSLPNSPEPHAYTLPWSMDVAQQLQTAMSEAEAKRTNVQMVLSEGGVDDREQKFYAAPQSQMPAKDYRDSAAISRPPA